MIHQLDSPVISLPAGATPAHPVEIPSAIRADDSPVPPQHSLPAASTRSLFVSHKRRMLLTYGLYNLENLLKLAQPFVLGLAINDLLNGGYTGLMIFVVQHLAQMLVETLRRMYVTRVFADIETELATGLAEEQRHRRENSSRFAARSALSRNSINLFEQCLPLAIGAVYSIAGALLMLGLYDWTLIPYCLGLVVPAVLLNSAYCRKTGELNRQTHMQRDGEFSDPAEVRRLYGEAGRRRIRLSDAQAIHVGLMELFVLGVLTATLVHFCKSAVPPPGDIFAVFCYLLMFIAGLRGAPRLLQQFHHHRETGFRLSRS